MRLLNFSAGVASALSLFLWALPGRALTKVEIEDPVDSVSEVSVPSGHNVVVSFENDRFVHAIWVDDPSILGVATDRPLCGGASQSNGCGFATTLRLTRLSGSLNELRGASFSQSGARVTVLNVITTDRRGQNNETYQFAVEVGGNSGVSQVSIVPTQATNVQPENTTAARRPALPSKRIDEIDLGFVREGVDIVIASGRADTQSTAWTALEDFLNLVQGDMGAQEAASRSGVNRALLTELERIGKSAIAQI